MLTIATLWLNNTPQIPSKESIKLLKNFLTVTKDHRCVLYVLYDMGMFERFFGDEIQVRSILEVCPDDQRVIYEEGNSLVTMVDHGKHLIMSHMLNTIDDFGIVTDIDIREFPTNWGEMERIIRRQGIVDNGENQFYIFAGRNRYAYEKHKSYYVKMLGSSYVDYARRGMLKVDIKRGLMMSYLRSWQEKSGDYEAIFQRFVQIAYGDMYRQLFGDQPFDKHRFMDAISDLFLRSTTLDEFVRPREIIAVSFEPTSFNEEGMNSMEQGVAFLFQQLEPYE